MFDATSGVEDMTKDMQIPSEVDFGAFLLVSDDNGVRAHTSTILKDYFHDCEILEAESSADLPYASDIRVPNLIVILDLISIANTDLAIIHLGREFPRARIAAIFEQDLEAILLKARFGRPHGFIRASAIAETYAAVLHLIAEGGEIMPWTTRMERTAIHFRSHRGLRACGTTETMLPPFAYGSANDHSDFNSEAESNPLTHREQEVLRLVTTGMQNKAIAYNMGISENTIRIHVHHILRKLGVRNRTEAANAGSRVVAMLAVLLLHCPWGATKYSEQAESIISQLV